MLSLPLYRTLSYEIFIRTHQAFAVLSAYSVWRHLVSTPLFPRVYIYIFAEYSFQRFSSSVESSSGDLRPLAAVSIKPLLPT
jgi:hypothetical protein